MAMLDTIELGTNGVWTNEFAGSKFEHTRKTTTSGKQFVFQKPKNEKTIEFNCTWLPRSTVQQLEILRDSGSAAVFTHNDGRVFNVILEDFDAPPVAEQTEYEPTHPYEVVLRMIKL